MNELLREKLFSLLADTSQVANKEMKNAYGCFMEHLKTTVSQPEADYPKVFRMLNITRIELVFIESLYRNEQGEKCPEISLSPKGIGTC